MIFALILILTALVLVAVVAPLWRSAGAQAGRGHFDRAVYRDQLTEIERDVARGLVAESNAAVARREIERRILATAEDPETLPQAAAHRRLAVLAGGGAAVFAVVLYFALGSPGLPELPFAHRLSPEAQQATVQSMVESLAARLQQQPDDLQGWLMLGRSYAVMGDAAKAAGAYDHARALRPDDMGIALAEAEVLLANRTVEEPLPARAVELLRQVQTRRPDQPETLWYLGMAAAQQRQFDQARDYWQHLLRVLPPGAPERQTVSAALDAIKDKR
jgi:cytochrome c-type biogenesis protein CcmH